VISNIAVKPINMRTDEELQFLEKVDNSKKNHINLAKLNFEKHFLERNNNLQKLIKSNDIPDTIYVPLILIEYSDMPHQETVQSFDAMMNDENWDGGIGAEGGIRDYFNIVSNGKVVFKFDVFGWYQSEYGYKYYCEKSGSTQPQVLTAEALDAANNDGVDFS
jgi:hypothetical protein